MTMNKIHNIYFFAGIMLLSNKIIATSPDYIIEKSLCFLGKLGKPEFIEFPKIKFSSQVVDKLYFNNFWEKYCNTWHTDKDDYKLMNIINFLLNSNLIRTTSFNHMISPVDNRSVYKQFEKYIGDIETVPDYDLKSNVHFKIVEYLTKYIDFNDRFFKLKMLQYES